MKMADPQRKKIKAVLVDFGDTLIDEGTVVRDSSGQAITAEVMPYAFEVIKTLRNRGLKFVLVANGKSSDIRSILRSTGLDEELDAILISEEVACKKPDKRIFEMALDLAGTEPGETLMVGNRASADIAGANALGIGSVWFHWKNHYQDKPEDSESTPDFTIDSLSQLIDLTDSPG
jgi:putative hydrolase of the HAD superfamily